VLTGLPLTAERKKDADDAKAEADAVKAGVAVKADTTPRRASPSRPGTPRKTRITPSPGLA
jgi:hypothetical protein